MDSMMEAIGNVLGGGLRYRLFRYASDRCYYRSSASILTMEGDILYAIDDGCDGYVLDTRTGKRIDLNEALAICNRSAPKRY